MNRQLLIVLTAVCPVVIGYACNRYAPPAADEPETASAASAPAESDSEAAAKASGRSADVPMDDINPPPETIPEPGTTTDVSEKEWRERLTPKQFGILRNAGTESPGSGAYNKFYGDGTYHCSACNNPLFSSETKFDSRTGWPSFYAPIEKGRVGERVDDSLGRTRTEIVCAHCGGHLGHVFEDGPEPTGLRYCVNSVALYFRPEDDGAY